MLIGVLKHKGWRVNIYNSSFHCDGYGVRNV